MFVHQDTMHIIKMKIPTTFETGLKEALNALCSKVIKAVKEDKVTVVILDDREVCEKKLIPMAMAIGFVNQSY